MSRSYRKPYTANCGMGVSCKEDKVFAHRGVRHVQNRTTRLFTQNPELFDDICFPHFRECPWNNVYAWKRDGRQRLRVPTAYHWHRHCMAIQGIGWPWGREHYMVWPPEWFVKYKRK